jgi:2-oxoisovalerate dehydrogenase E1 component alpha subunit
MADQDLPVIAKFAVRRRAYIAPDGTLLRDLPDFASDQELVVSLYRAMVLARTFDLKAVSLQRTGRLGTYATSLGQEAVAVGLASAMRPEDTLLPSYRDNAALLWRGVTMEEILLFWGGDERGNHWSGPTHDFPFCIPVGSQAPHAAGVAYSFKYRNMSFQAVRSARTVECGSLFCPCSIPHRGRSRAFGRSSKPGHYPRGGGPPAAQGGRCGAFGSGARG